MTTESSPLDTLKWLVDQNLSTIAQIHGHLNNGTADAEQVFKLIEKMYQRHFDALSEHVKCERINGGATVNFDESALIYDDGTPVREHIVSDRVITRWYPRHESYEQVLRDHEERVLLANLIHEDHDDPPADQ